MVAPVCTGRLIGYARVSTDDQDLALQIDSLTSLGVNPHFIFTDKMSGAKTDRPGLDACLAKLQLGDTLVVGGSIDSVVPCTTWSSLLANCAIEVSAFDRSAMGSSTPRARREN